MVRVFSGLSVANSLNSSNVVCSICNTLNKCSETLRVEFLFLCLCFRELNTARYIKSKFNLEQATKAQKESKRKLYSFFNLSAR
jgi:hypothetical protein